MPILYHFTSSKVNAENEKYSLSLCNISVHNAQLFLLEKLSPNFYKLLPHFIAIFAYLFIICAWFACFVHHQKASVFSPKQILNNY